MRSSRGPRNHTSVQGDRLAHAHDSPLPRTLIRVPLYGQVLGVLRQRINDAVYAEQEQLPPEDRLAAEFGVSRATVRQAVGELVREGLVDRRQGSGTFVRGSSRRPSSQRFSASLSDLVVETKATRTVRANIERHVTIPGSIAEALRLAKPEATVVRRVRSLDDTPFAYSVNYVPEKYAALLSASNLRKTGPMSLLRTKGVRLGSAQQVIQAEQADIDVCEQLEMEFAAPVLYAERLVLSADDDPVLFVKTWYRADMYEYRVTLKAHDMEEGPGFRLE
jgi:GntR family transcriptional regulator